MRPYNEKKLSSESIPSDQLNYSLRTQNNGAILTQNTSPISTDTTKEQTAPLITNTQPSSCFTDIKNIQSQILNDALAIALTQSIMPSLGYNLQGVLMGYINLTLFKGFPTYDENTNYEEEYHRAFIMNEIMLKKLSQYCEEINLISERAKRLQEIYDAKVLKINLSYSGNNLSRSQEMIGQSFAQNSYGRSYQQDQQNKQSNINQKGKINNNLIISQEDHLYQSKIVESHSNNNNINNDKDDIGKRNIKQQQQLMNDLEGEITFSDFDGNNNNNNECHTQSQMNNKRRKNRRCATQIQKKFECPYSECKKTYGSEVSLNLHIKLKHNGGNKTEREKLARQMFVAQINGKQIPQASLNLPPGFLEQYKDGLKKTKSSREIPYSSNNLKPNSTSNIIIPQTAKSECQIKID